MGGNGGVVYMLWLLSAGQCGWLHPVHSTGELYWASCSRDSSTCPRAAGSAACSPLGPLPLKQAVNNRLWKKLYYTVQVAAALPAGEERHAALHRCESGLHAALLLAGTAAAAAAAAAGCCCQPCGLAASCPAPGRVGWQTAGAGWRSVAGGSWGVARGRSRGHSWPHQAAPKRHGDRWQAAVQKEAKQLEQQNTPVPLVVSRCS